MLEKFQSSSLDDKSYKCLDCNYITTKKRYLNNHKTNRHEGKTFPCPNCEGTNLVLGPPKIFYRRNLSGTFREVHWYHSDNPKKVQGAPSQGFLIFLGFDKNITKIENWLLLPHFLANFQVSYHFGKLLTARSQGFTASKNQSLDQ